MKPEETMAAQREPIPGAINAAQGSSVTCGETYHFADQVGYLLRRSFQRHVAIFQQVIPDSQLTSAQFVVMCTVLEHTQCSMSDVVKATAIDQATVRGIVDRLKARKLIAVAQDSADKRKVMVTLTDEGENLIDQMVPFAARITEETFGGLNPAERVAMLYLLRKMSALGES